MVVPAFFLQMFDIKDKLRNRTDPKNFKALMGPVETLDWDIRESLLLLSGYVSGRAPDPPFALLDTDPVLAILVEDLAGQEGICMVLEPEVREVIVPGDSLPLPQEENLRAPLIILQYRADGQKTAFQAVSALGSLLRRNEMQAKLNVTSAEKGRLLEILKRHSAMLKVAGFQGSRPLGSGFAWSFLCPITKHAPNKQVLDLCSFPGCQIVSKFRCSRCQQARYCGKDHQTADWKAHKPRCMAGRPSVLVSPENAPMDTSKLINLDFLTAKEQKLQHGGAKLPLRDEPICFPVKVQTNATETMLIYDAKKRIMMYASPDFFASRSDWKNLYDTVQKLGFHAPALLVGGKAAKVYLDATIESGSLRVFLDVARKCEW